MRDSEEDTGSLPPEQRDEAHDRLVGTTIMGRYQVGARIGVGGMGAVYEGKHVVLQKRVAIKVLHEHMGRDPSIVARFEREAVAAGRIRHPCVVTATDFGRLDSGAFFMVLEHVDGKNLHQLLDEVEYLEADRAVRIAYQIGAALVAAHGEGIVHRDLKPENVMLLASRDEDDSVKVLDFGIAKLAMTDVTEGEERLTQQGLVFGTAEYMSPEQARGETVDVRTDIYAVGMILYEMLEGHPAFEGENPMSVLSAQMFDEVPPLTRAVPEALRRLVERATEKDREARPGTALELTESLAEVAAEQGWDLPSPRTMTSRYGSAAELAPKPPLVSLRPLAVSGNPVPLWIPIAALVFGLLVGVAVFSLRGWSGGAPGSKRSDEAQERRVAEGQLLVEARQGDRDALGELRRLVEKDTATGEAGANQISTGSRADRYMALGRGYSVIRHYQAALEAYERAVREDPHLAQDSDLLVDVSVAIEKRDSVDAGLVFAHRHLGAHGADIIYDVWRDHLGKPGWTPIVARAQKLVRGGHLNAQASPALRMALELDAAQLCIEYKNLLPRAVEDADVRSLPTLRALQRQRGCGAAGKEDCFPCLRDAEVPLSRAIEAARDRPEPEFLGSAQD